MTLQSDKLLLALENLATESQKYGPLLSPEDFDTYIAWFKQVLKEKPIGTYEELFGCYDNDPATATDQLIPLLALKSLSSQSEILFTEDVRLQSDDQGIYVFNGNLKITGNLKYDGYIFVAGDVDVLGRIESLGNWPGLFAAGSIRTQAINQVTGAEADILLSTGDILVKHFIGSGNIQALGRIKSQLLITSTPFWKVGDQAEFQYRIEPDYGDWVKPFKQQNPKLATQLNPEITEPDPEGLTALIERIETAIDENKAVWKR